MSIRIASLYPGLTNAQGDASNADVIARQLSWLGISVDIVTVDETSLEIPVADLYVLGDVLESDMDRVKEHFSLISSALKRQIEEGSSLLAVGSAYLLLMDAQLLSGNVVPTSERIVSDYVGHLPSGEALIGFQNSAITYVLGEGERPLGRTMHGIGDCNGTEGVLRCVGRGIVVATSLHGPVAARSPAITPLLFPDRADVSLPGFSLTAEGARAIELANAWFIDTTRVFEGK